MPAGIITCIKCAREINSSMSCHLRNYCYYVSIIRIIIAWLERCMWCALIFVDYLSQIRCRVINENDIKKFFLYSRCRHMLPWKKNVPFDKNLTTFCNIMKICFTIQLTKLFHLTNQFTALNRQHIHMNFSIFLNPSCMWFRNSFLLNIEEISANVKSNFLSTTDCEIFFVC